MASEKARYWMAVGAAALFLSNSFAGRPSDWALRLADRSVSTAQRISGQAMRYAIIARVILARDEAGFVQSQDATAHAQTHLAFVQTAMAHRQAALARIQTERIRLRADHPVVCSRQNFTINVPDVHEVAEGTI